jgi:hypothetical protein
LATEIGDSTEIVTSYANGGYYAGVCNLTGTFSQAMVMGPRKDTALLAMYGLLEVTSAMVEVKCGSTFKELWANRPGDSVEVAGGFVLLGVAEEMEEE